MRWAGGQGGTVDAWWGDPTDIEAALNDHPAVRDTATVMLGTRDAQALYARFGFVDVAARPPRGFTTTDMVRVR